MIAYKVVEKNTRWGSNWTMIKQDYIRNSKFEKIYKYNS